MKFYEIDEALQEAMRVAEKPVRLRVVIDTTGKGHFEDVFEQDILEADFFSLKEAAGGVSSRGALLLENPQGILFIFRHRAGVHGQYFVFAGGRVVVFSAVCFLP